MVDQFHPEYADGRLELSVAAESPVDAADTAVLVRSTIRAVGRQYDYRTSFSPKVEVGGSRQRRPRPSQCVAGWTEPDGRWEWSLRADRPRRGLRRRRLDRLPALLGHRGVGTVVSAGWCHRTGPVCTPAGAWRIGRLSYGSSPGRRAAAIGRVRSRGEVLRSDSQSLSAVGRAAGCRIRWCSS